MHLKSELLSQVPGIRHGFGSWSEPVPAPFAADWEATRAKWKQVHKVDVSEIRGPAQECGEVDALFSSARGAPVAVMHADCTPILLARRDGAKVAAIHGGWRGTIALIVRATWDKLAAQGERAQDWVAAVGPTIGPCCYEVSPEIAADFERVFAEHGAGLAVPRTRYLDLPAVNAAELRRLGIGQVDLIRACTKCSVARAGDGTGVDPGAFLYCSYRRDQSKTRQYSVIEITRP